jgi:hypothetical protein
MAEFALYQDFTGQGLILPLSRFRARGFDKIDDKLQPLIL